MALPVADEAERLMRRQRKTPQQAKLQRLARAGKREEARAYLEELLQVNPLDKWAREELYHLLHGELFSFEKEELEQHHHRAMRSRKRLAQLLEEYHREPELILSLPPRKLRKKYKELKSLQQQLSHSADAAEWRQMEQYRNALQRRLGQKGLVSRMLRPALLVLLLLGGLCSAGFFLQKKAVHAADVLAATRKEALWGQAENRLHAYDTGLNRLFCSRTHEEAQKLRNRLQSIQEKCTQLDLLLRQAERREHADGVSLGTRAQIERLRQMVGEYRPELNARWQKICTIEQENMLRQKEEALAQLQKPFSPIVFQGKPEEDISELQARAGEVSRLLELYADARDAYGIAEKHLIPLRKEEQQVARSLRSAENMLKGMRLFPSAHTYAQYREMLLGIQAEHYPPAAEWLKIRNVLPNADEVQNGMRVYRRDLTPEQLEDATACLLGKKGTFPGAFPATRQQLQLLDELFSNPALRRPIFELTNAEGEVCYADESPVVRNKRVVFLRSGLDPGKSMSHQRKVEWQDPHHVWSRKIDTTPLHKIAILDNKPRFLMSASIPAVLTNVLNLESEDCPALAKAYVYSTLARVLELHSWKTISGMHYAPTLKTHIESFRRLQQEWMKVPLHGTCWISPAQDTKEAEEAYSRWFRQHAGADYAKEMAHNFQQVLNITPRYCGYVNEKGQPILYRTMEEGTLLWYVGQDMLTAIPYGEPTERVLLFSPIFSTQ